ncbi:MAG TPA: hypothetical protein VHN14_20135 [Kofleriaceae bacterium]|nr:hypothetical protein [Kofleriaceae bacterium]
MNVLGAIARGTQKCGFQLTSMAWDVIEAAQRDELAFLLGATCVDTTAWQVRKAVRGVFENQALRQLLRA